MFVIRKKYKCVLPLLYFNRHLFLCSFGWLVGWFIYSLLSFFFLSFFLRLLFHIGLFLRICSFAVTNIDRGVCPTAFCGYTNSTLMRNNDAQRCTHALPWIEIALIAACVRFLYCVDGEFRKFSLVLTSLI